MSQLLQGYSKHHNPVKISTFQVETQSMIEPAAILYFSSDLLAFLHFSQDEVKNEITVMNQLDHVNLIQLYDAFESQNDIILVME